MTELSRGLSEIMGAIRHLEQRIDVRFGAVDARFGSVEAWFDTLDHKVSSQFMWIVGIQVTTLVAIVVALISRG